MKLNHVGLWNNFQGLFNDINIAADQVSLDAVNRGVPSSNTAFGLIYSLTVADFQRAGYQGLITLGQVSGTATISVLSPLGDDYNHSKITLSGNTREYGAVVAYDKTGDGYLDFAFGDQNANSLSFVTNNAGALSWMNGTATTGTGRPTGTGSLINYIEASAVDLNNNGTVDIVEHTNGSGTSALTAFINDQVSANAFGAAVHVAGVFATLTGGYGQAMTWADYNNDGFMDLYLNRGKDANGVSDTDVSRIYWNNHNGGFGITPGTTGATATYFSDALKGSGSLAIDWNHDGKMDVIEVPMFTVLGNIVWYANQGGGVFSAGASVSGLSRNDYVGVSPYDFNWDGAPDLMVNVNTAATYLTTIFNNNRVADGSSIHLQIFDSQGINAFYANTVQLYNSAGGLVSSQIINPQMGLTSNDTSAFVYFYGLNASETYTAVLLKSVSGVSSDVSGVATLGGNSIENVNATWTGLTTGLATHNYVLSAEAGSNNANGNFIGTGYNDTFFATAGTDTFIGGAGWQTHYGTPAWSITRGEDVVDFSLAGSTAVTVNLNTTTAQATGFNTVTLTGIEGITGGAGNDNLTANSTAGVNSLLDGRGGNDTYTISGGGHTLLTFTNINNSDATAGNGSDTAIGFGVGNVISVTTADVIDLSALLTGYTGTAYVYTDITTSKPVLDKASEGLMNYLSVTNNGTHTSISVDRDGTGSTFTPTLVLTLNNVVTDMETLLVNHQLIV
ncbi:hypothetical protein EMIT0P265_330003 [Pseudomonas zeae]